MGSPTAASKDGCACVDVVAADTNLEADVLDKVRLRLIACACFWQVFSAYSGRGKGCYFTNL